MLRVVTSLFIGAVILGECEVQLMWTAASILSSSLQRPLLFMGFPVAAASASGWASRHWPPYLPLCGLILSLLHLP